MDQPNEAAILPTRSREEWEQLSDEELKRSLRDLRKEWQQMARTLTLPTGEFRALSKVIDTIEMLLEARHPPPQSPSNPTLL